MTAGVPVRLFPPNARFVNPDGTITLEGLKALTLVRERINDPFSGLTAANVATTASGGLSGLTVAAQLVELDTEKEATGTAAAAVASHVGAADPHVQYALESALSASSGATLIGHSTSTVADALSAISLVDYTALRAYAGSIKAVRITGYLGAAAPSGISGLFTVDDSDTTSADNGGTIIVASNGKRWKRVYDGYVNVKWFGAKGDNSNDDTAEIQAAIDLLHTTGGTVFVPPGVYLISNSIVLNEHVTLLGAGAGCQSFPNSDTAGTTIGGVLYSGSWFRFKAGAAAALGWNDEDLYAVVKILYDNPNYVAGYVDRRRFATVRNLGIDGNAGGNTGNYSCVTTVDAWNMKVDHCFLRNPRGCGITCKNSVFTSTNDFLVTNNWIMGANTTVSTKGVNFQSADSQCFGNHVAGFAYGLYTGGGTNVSHNHVWGNIVGVFITSAANLAQLVTNYIYDNEKQGVIVSGVDNVATNDDAYAVMIVGNLIANNGADTGALATERVGLQISGNSQAVLVNGNLFGNRDSGPLQHYGVRCATANATLIYWGSNGFHGHLTADTSFTSAVTLRKDPTSISSAQMESHVGKLLSNVDANSNRITSVSALSYATWDGKTVSGNTVPCANSVLVTLNEAAPISVTDITSTLAGIPEVTIRNTGANAITFVHNTAKLRLNPGVDVVLNQHQSIKFAFVSGTVWQHTTNTLDADLTSWAAVTRAAGFDTFAATPSSANLRTLLTDETGTGAAVFGSSPTIDAPTVSGITNLTGGRIAFPATQTASTDANTLDDYEEGAWTPAITFATPGDLAVTYTTQVGWYTKVGKLVSVGFEVQTLAFTHTTASGVLRVTGIPFTAHSTASVRHIGALAFQGITKAGYTSVVADISAGASTINFLASASGSAISGVAAADTPTGGTVILRGTVTYMASA